MQNRNCKYTMSLDSLVECNILPDSESSNFVPLMLTSYNAHSEWQNSG